nr:hypothetical protein [Candidatus Sigynarchaeota archaeon]
MSKPEDKNEAVESASKKYRAAVDKNTSIEIIKDREVIYWIIKKDLLDYETFISASEAPVSNLFTRELDSFEACIAERSVLEKEVFPIADAIKTVFGTQPMELDKISLIIGSGENDYVSLDETDLKNLRVEPTLFGLQDFIEKNKDGVLGFGIREFETDKGNLIFMRTKLVRPTKNIISIELNVISSIQQRGFYLQKESHTWVGLQKYIVIKTTQIDDEKLLAFLKELDINWEIIFLRRTLAVNDWLEIECERNGSNLKSYLRYMYPILGYMDIQNIVKVVEGNNLNFKIASRTAELLSKQKKEILNNENVDVTYTPIEMAEIIAAARLAAAYHGVKRDIKFESDVRLEDVLRFEKILANY